MLKRWISISIIAVTSSILTPVSTAIVPEHLTLQSHVPASRVARLRHGINLSHWFAQSGDYSKSHLASHTTAEDIALIKSMGFDHVRLTIEPAPLYFERSAAKNSRQALIAPPGADCL
jgi:aryl-phospho-beta-D-glucosidase BglC (GH1 family)